MLQKADQQWKRQKLLSLKTSQDSSLKWSTPTRNKAAVGGGSRIFTSPYTNDARMHSLMTNKSTRSFGSSSSVLRANYSPSPRVNSSTSSLSPVVKFKNNTTPSPSNLPSSKNKLTTPLSKHHHHITKRLYINPATIDAIHSEVNDLPLPATLANICLALTNSEVVLDVHAEGALGYGSSDLDADDATDGADDNGYHDFLSFIGLTTSLQNLSVSSSEQRKTDFKEALRPLINGGNKCMVNTWEECCDGLGEVFCFAVVRVDASDVVAVVHHGEDEGETGGESAAVVTEDEATTTTTKTTPKRNPTSTYSTKKKQQQQTKIIPKRAFPTAIKSAKQSIRQRLFHKKTSTTATTATPRFLSLECYKDRILKKVGRDKWKEVFKHSHALTEPSLSSTLLDAAATRLDVRIAEKEQSLRSSQLDETLMLKEKEHKERLASHRAASLLRPLTDDEQGIVRNAIYGIGPEDEILAQQDADSVQRRSLHCLQPGQWLNDEIINYFLKNCLAKRDEKLCTQQPGRKRSHFFNSYFIQTMFDEKNGNYDLRGRYAYKNVKRWSKKVPGKDIFNLKYIVCPINLDNMHWVSAVIFMELKKIQYYDSLGGTDYTKLKGLLEYLKDEWRAKKGGEMDVSEWELVGCTRDTPRQKNGFDCGVFTCMICDFVSQDCPLSFSQEHVNQCRERIALSIMKNCAIE